jgi:hypothetical protein
MPSGIRRSGIRSAGVRGHISSRSSWGVRPMAMLGAPVSRITELMVPGPAENTSNQVRNFSDKIGRDCARLLLQRAELGVPVR